jgi:hypothetical protein
MELGRRRLLKFGAFATVVALAACTTATGPAPKVSMPGGKVEVQWLGQSTTKITTPGGKIIVIDPFMTGNPKTPAEYKDLAKLGKVDLILVTHGHGDHTGDVAALHKLTDAMVAGNSDLVQNMVALGWVPAAKTTRFNMSGSIRPLGPGITITQWRRRTRPISRSPTRRPRSRPSMRAARRAASSSSWRTVSASTTWATPDSSAACA